MVLKCFRAMQNMAFKVFNKKLFEIERHDSPWQHPSSPSKKMGTEEPSCGACFKCGKAGHWAEKLPFLLTAARTLSKFSRSRTLGS